MASLPRVIVKPRRARPFFARHPWLFVTSIARVEGEPKPGSEVEVFSHEGQFIARGLFNPNSAIRVRLYRWDGGALDDEFWAKTVAAAVRLRREILHLGGPGAGYRLIASESDGLSGLTVDRYDRWLVVQFTSLALFERRELLLGLLAQEPDIEGILSRPDRTTAEQEGIRPHEDVFHGTPPAAPVEISENGLTFWVDLKGGQKTGFYLDQRENRRAVAQYCQGKRVLDLFTYTGAFALNALKHGGAESVLGIDSSSTAIEVARHHAVLNQLGKARFESADVFDALETIRSGSDRFGVVICDPPKFARHPRGVEDALKGYLRLNRAALDVLEPDGILVTCSCSGLVERGLFADLIGQLAELSGRSIQILEQRGQAPDHPVSASCLETEYLKCFVCRVS
ncbi:class I SAM-dependent rRNA methyltransferase [Singulisphaera acidiphila]|uniref:Putative SAM-dependent methyltransferase n=1 Tax=Singulisphaera acidiphila (strain ATCC BAA-1392 / DSM 18658 / VKM B-2454 / MOB10) TaxID=886293 RepID=L0DA89_SINAD|nr:class I SAM-dependent rRNA methyltransferase [Singulisphaera acidiphila]AGA25775.1 putative SAM-dependent methyltransferase [Singulisphaera acidiphila DSM 18658]